MPFLCEGCKRQLSDLAKMRVQNFPDFKVRLFFRYEGLVRTLIMRAKIRNDAVAAGFICEATKNLLKAVDDSNLSVGSLIVPAPASLWGRVRGRFDLAELLALSLFDPAQVVGTSGPRLLFRRKRAGRNAQELGNINAQSSNHEIFNIFKDDSAIRSRISSSRRILIVDDVMTTGLTMRTIFSQLKELGAQSIEGLVIASSSC